MIESLLDNDFYSWTVGQLLFEHFPTTTVSYKFHCRSSFYKKTLVEKISLIKSEIAKLADLSLTTEEYRFLQTIPFLKPNYVDWFSSFKFHPHKHVHIGTDSNNDFYLTISGNMLECIFYEVPILAIISQILTNDWQNTNWYEKSLVKLEEKVKLIEKLNNPKFNFADFGTRRRYNFENQDLVVRFFNERLNILSENKNFTGTSNLYLAMKHKVKHIGSMSHQLFMLASQKFPLLTHQQDILDKWMMSYDGNMGIALSDTFGSDYFFKNFSLRFAKLFNGVRHDSGDPEIFAEKTINHYEKLGVDPKTKTLLFSDGLDMPTAIELFEKYNKRINVSFGIGTNLTNDCGGIPASIVIKLDSVDGLPVVKLSDVPDKVTCSNEAYLNYIKSIVYGG